jgi:2-methylisocitrate lyase-like PEP mutase family enzyme
MHRPGEPLLLPNAWDAGSAKLLAGLGYRAIATTSSGHAATLGRRDGLVTREEALDHGRALSAATALPVSADLEDGFSDAPHGVARCVRDAAACGLAGCSIEDHPRSGEPAVYDLGLARERIAAAAEVARASETRIVLTARAENYLHGRVDLDDTIARLQAFEAAGADVVYAPGLVAPWQIERVVAAVELPVNILLRPNGPSIAELARAGVARISLGGSLQKASLGAVQAMARELLEDGTASFWGHAQAGAAAIDDFD